MRESPGKILKDKIAQTLPLLEDARKHNNRSLLIDLSDSLVKELEKAILKSTNEDKRLYRAVRRQIRTMLLQSAYVESEGLSLGSEANDEIPREPKLDIRGHFEARARKGAIEQEELRLPMEEGEGAGVSHENKNRNPSKDISLNLLDERKIFEASADHNEDTFPEKYTGENFELDKPASMCDTPFTLDDFSLAKEAKKQSVEDDLIERLEDLKARIEKGEQI